VARRPIRYVALGDSYTIGTSVSPPERFPEQLVAALAGRPPGIELVADLAVNGYTTRDLIRTELPPLPGLVPELVTLCIGVNDVVQGVSLDRYESNVAEILEAVLAVLPPGVAASRLVTIAIPDYTVTPAGADYGDPVARSVAIGQANGVMARLAAARGVAFVDIVDISLEAAFDPTLVAADGLHPSGRQYARWVDRIAPVVGATLAE
jgi:lysophospholipase L1-like esterase